MGILSTIIDFVLHLDKYISILIDHFGIWSYAILFFIVFLETGLVLTPFLPGDSLLFAIGAFSAIGSFNVWIMFGLLTAAAILGDSLNYYIGSKIGKNVFKKNYKFLNKSHLDKTKKFFKKHGGKTIILARFIPIVRTFAPFLAGIGKMSYTRFLIYNIIGAILWVGLFLWLGYFFGNIPFVQENFTLVIIIIMLTSVIPVIYALINEFLKKNKEKNKKNN